MTCHYCGADTVAGEPFCRYCGTRQNPAPKSAAVPVPEQTAPVHGGDAYIPAEPRDLPPQPRFVGTDFDFTMVSPAPAPAEPPAPRNSPGLSASRQLRSLLPMCPPALRSAAAAEHL